MEIEATCDCTTRPANLYARVVHGRVDALIMPGPDGMLDTDAPRGEEWYAVWWPVNPHDTGERMIRAILDTGWASIVWEGASA